MKVAIVGRGKVAAAFSVSLRKKMKVRSHASRGDLRGLGDAELVILAVRDGALAELAARLARSNWPSAAFVHLSGALGPEVLAPLRASSLGVAQAHPMLSFASERHPPRLEGASLLLRGDRVAVERMRRVAKAVGLVVRRWQKIDPALYHAAAALAANGGVALAYGAAELFSASGAKKSAIANLLAPLLRSVSHNVERLGPLDALTGPIRRGDAATVGRHLAAIGRAAPDLLPLYRASARIQVQMARRLGDAPARALDEVNRTLSEADFRPARTKKSAPAVRPHLRPKPQKKS